MEKSKQEIAENSDAFSVFRFVVIRIPKTACTVGTVTDREDKYLNYKKIMTKLEEGDVEGSCYTTVRLWIQGDHYHLPVMRGWSTPMSPQDHLVDLYNALREVV
ncbi:hypothetical protein NECAME_09159 [Necator americanus]|uniref:Uncharacterized protein n=1 Tax=Necator americanus TaxID=51031 RepID=W2TH16_NECAM|nr:hypothetical protein NECAME_09159 [Necator americanus]ETN80486.1 hypothetical protein NECAME_09159 [Necator americanus]